MATFQVPRGLLFSPWTFILVGGAGLAVLVAYWGYWSFLGAVHPFTLGAAAVLLTLWLLFAIAPKITVHAMRLVDVKLPRGDSAVPVVGRFVRIFVVLVGPLAIYCSLMALREETAGVAEYLGAAVVGVVLGAIGWRSVTLLNIMRETFPEDEIRKGLLDTGVYPEEAIRKLKQAADEIEAEGNFDKKRIRLRRLAHTDQVLRNKNYDPHSYQHRTTTGATIAGSQREGHVDWARRSRERVALHADLADEEVHAKIAEQRAMQRGSHRQYREPIQRQGAPSKDEMWGYAKARLRKNLRWVDVRANLRQEVAGKYKGPPEDFERYMAQVDAILDEIEMEMLRGDL